MEGPNVLFCSIFINMWEKRKVGVLKKKPLSSRFPFNLCSIFPLFSLIKISLTYPFFCHFVSCSVLCLPAVGFILSFLHLLNLTH